MSGLIEVANVVSKYRIFLLVILGDPKATRSPKVDIKRWHKVLASLWAIPGFKF